MRETLSETVMFDRMERKLYSAVISDVLDDLGHRDHTLNNAIRPIGPDMVLAGRARTMLVDPWFEAAI